MDDINNDTVGETLVASFQSTYSKYESYTKNIEGLLVTLLEAHKVEILSTEARTKTLESFSDEIARTEKQGKYKDLSDITDISGRRIVAFYEEDVRKICEIIEKNFDVESENSVDKNLTIDPDRFGYLSVHYVVSHSTQRGDLPENVQFKGMKAEIQVRTVLQHAWAVLDRRLRYNNEGDIPRAVKRKLFRVSALLEAADESLSEIEKRIEELRANYESQVKQGGLVGELNLDAVEIYLRDSAHANSLQRAANKAGIFIIGPHTQNYKNTSLLISALQAAGIKDIADLDAILQNFVPMAQRVFSNIVKQRRELKRKDLRLSVAGLARVALFSIQDKQKQTIIADLGLFSAELTAMIISAIEEERS